MWRIKRAIQLFRAAWDAVWTDKSLLIFPMLSGVISLVILSTHLLPALLIHGANRPEFIKAVKRQLALDSPGSFILVFSAYLTLSFAGFMCDGALMMGNNQRFNGKDPTIASVVDRISDRWLAVLRWAAVAATMGVVIRVLQVHGGTFGEWFGEAFGIARPILTVLVLPFIVIGSMRVRDAMAQSRMSASDTWMEALLGQVPITAFTALVALPATRLASTGLDRIYNRNFSGAIVVAIGLTAAIVVNGIARALSVAFQTTIFRYAAKGRVPEAETDAEEDRHHLAEGDGDRADDASDVAASGEAEH